MRHRAWLDAPASLLLCIILLGCTVPGTKPERTLEHIVVVWLKEPGNPAHRQTIIEASEVLRTIPGVRSLKSGTVVPSERAIVDSSFDVALIVSFADHAALDTYLAHPLHVTLVDETLKPLVARIRVFDFMQERIVSANRIKPPGARPHAFRGTAQHWSSSR